MPNAGGGEGDGLMSTHMSWCVTLSAGLGMVAGQAVTCGWRELDSWPLAFSQPWQQKRNIKINERFLAI